LSRPWETLDRKTTPDGELELRRRGRDDFLILIGGRVLMNSRECRSEQVLGVETCRDLPEGARVLVGGLGMGLTLRAVLDSLPEGASVDVAELHPLIADWCQGPLAELTGGASSDERVSIELIDVAERIRSAEPGRWDAIVLDLFEGPHARTDAEKDPLYGRVAINRSWRALAPGGVLGVWSEAPEAGFESRLRKRGFQVESRRPGRGGYRHWVVLARRPARPERVRGA
jgi:spermidine synthase